MENLFLFLLWGLQKSSSCGRGPRPREMENYYEKLGSYFFAHARHHSSSSQAAPASIRETRPDACLVWLRRRLVCAGFYGDHRRWGRET